MTSLDKLLERVQGAADRSGGLTRLLLSVRDDGAVTWSAADARFLVNGEPVDPERIKLELERLEDKTARKILSYNKKLTDGEWTLVEWRTAMKELMEDDHVLFAALAVGGIALALRESTTRRRIQRDHKALQRFSTAIRQGKVPSTEVPVPSMQGVSLQPEVRPTSRRVPNAPMIHRRSRTYLHSIKVTYHLLSHRAHILAGYTEARRQLSPAEHCRSKFVSGEGWVDGCLETARKGWIDIRSMPPIGTLVCMQFCKCWMQYRR